MSEFVRGLYDNKIIRNGALALLVVGGSAIAIDRLTPDTTDPNGLTTEDQLGTYESTPIPNQALESSDLDLQATAGLTQQPLNSTDGIIHPHAGEDGYVQNTLTGTWFKKAPNPLNSYDCFSLGVYQDYMDRDTRVLNQQTEFGAVTAMFDPAVYREPSGARNIIVYDANGLVIASHTTDTQLDPEIAKRLQPGTLVCDNGPVTNFTP